MKKVATLALLAAASAGASAQSNVTLFGVVDVAGRYVKNGDVAVKSLASGGLSTGRLGVRGIEDLGGGLQAGFWLESGINADNGTSSDTTRFWNRRATVSVLSKTLGEVRLGRDFTPIYTGFSSYDPFGTNGVATLDKFFVSQLGASTNPTSDTNTRADNQVSYFTPDTLGGIYGQLSAAAGEGTSGKRFIGGRLGYAAGPLDVSASAGDTLVTAVGGVDKFKAYNLAGSYDFGVVKALGGFGERKFGNLKVDVFHLGALVPVGAGVVRLSYVNANAKGGTIDSDDANQIAIGYVHNLSKRTALYTTYAKINNKGAAKFVTGGSSTVAPAPVVGKDSTGFEAGLRHSF